MKEEGPPGEPGEKVRQAQVEVHKHSTLINICLHR